MSKRPNILLITSDQHRADCFGFERKRKVKTPFLDRLAARGTRFDSVITPNVVCQPSRASILTGLLPLTHGVYDNHVSLDATIGESGWARTLANAGYRSGFIGKGHFGEDPASTPYGSPESRQHSAGFPDSWNGPFMGFDEVRMMILGHWHQYLPCEQPPRGQHFERWFWGHGSEGEAWDLWSQNVGQRPSATQTWNSALPAAWHSTTWVTDEARSFIQAQDQQSPFCLWVSYPDPHHSFDCPEPWSRLYQPEDVDISRNHRRDLDARPWWHRAALEREPLGKTEAGRILRREYSRIEPQTDAQLAEMTANYYGMISFVDEGVGRILDTLNTQGLTEDTIVIFTSDHGELLGDHGLYLKGPTHYEGLLRVGMVAAGPGISAGACVHEPVSTLDLAPTFYDLSGVSPSIELQGTSLKPLLHGEQQSRDFALNEWDMMPSRAGIPLELRTVRTRSAKLTLDRLSGDGELYDLHDDPDEMVNRYGDPGKAALQRELEDMLQARPGPITSTRANHDG
jgi:arylsulfatase A-like enzyme